jgi:hypothetical protein
MNAVTHNLSGQNLILQETELAAYNRMAAAMLVDLNPKTEPERQIAQKRKGRRLRFARPHSLIDINFRLNRLAAIENNLFSFGLAQNETDTDQDDRIEVMAAQTRAWIERANSFDTLGRYEARLSRQLLKYQEEFERLQTERRNRSTRQIEELEEDRFDPASFGQIADSCHILTHMTPPKPIQPDEPCTAGDLVAGEVAA